ncbi:MAG TPA: 50S ribosomal protein L9 [Saprospiraceae bacterium]|nr:50S ribosomal protein L9 [Saprospiraceae bacterium]
MEIILLKDIEKVGDKHTIVSVKPGYARNFLIPQGLAIVANDTNRRSLDSMKRREAAVEQKVIDAAKNIAAQLAGKLLKIGAKAGTSGKIFGSVTNVQLAAALEEQFGITLDRKLISIPEDVKTLGEYEANLHLHKTLDAKVKFEVVEE